MFHKGATLENPHGLLEGDSKEARVARFQNAEDIKAKKSALQAMIKQWIAVQDSA